jgi:hypothetical protein
MCLIALVCVVISALQVEALTVRVADQAINSNILLNHGDCANMNASSDVDQSLKEKFNVQLCIGSGDHGKFVVQKMKGCTGATRISNDAQTEHEIRDIFGEDEFLLELEGPEILALQSVSPRALLETCVYEMPFKWTIPGRYHVKLVWLREHFDASQELVQAWPESHFDLPLGSDIFLEIGNVEQMKDALMKSQTQTDVPTCDPRRQHEGRWVFKQSPDQDIFPQSGPFYYKSRCIDRPGDGMRAAFEKIDPEEVEKFVLYGGHNRRGKCHEHLPIYVDHKKYDWLANDCRLRRFTRDEATSCLQKRSLNFRGDSHMRKLFLTMAQYSCNITKSVQDAKWASICADGLQHGQSCAHLCYIVDHEGDNPGLLDGVDLVVANFGHHPADGSHHWTLQRYQQQVDTYVNKVQRDMQQPHAARFAWHETNVLPFRNDPLVHWFGDWRTIHRLASYNRHANEKFNKLGIPIVSSFEPTRAFSQHADDDAHFPDEILQPMMHQVLSILCEQ